MQCIFEKKPCPGANFLTGLLRNQRAQPVGHSAAGGEVTVQKGGHPRLSGDEVCSLWLK